MTDMIDLRKLQSIEFEMLKLFKEICTKLDLPYFLDGGTTLGAVRHKGFIPWDDDVDVGLLRKDYNVFIEKAQALLPEHIFLQTYETDPEYPNNYAKLRNSRTTFIETSSKNLNINHGVYIDIFPFDNYPDNKISACIFEYRRRLMTHRINDGFFLEEKKPRTVKGKAIDIIIRALYPSVRSAVIKRDQLHKSVKYSSHVSSMYGPRGSTELASKEVFDTLIELPFEGELFSVPEKYDEYLIGLYGDYMELPPPEKRITCHPVEVVDLEKPYTDYIQTKR